MSLPSDVSVTTTAQCLVGIRALPLEVGGILSLMRRPTGAKLIGGLDYDARVIEGRAGRGRQGCGDRGRRAHGLR